MVRTVSEWVGKNDNSSPPDSCKRRIIDRQGGKCAITGAIFKPGDKIEFDHKIPLWLGGENREKNLQAIIGEAHKRKTSAEATVRAKVNSVRLKHLGIKRKSSNPMPGGKGSKWKKKMDGTVVRRNERK